MGSAALGQTSAVLATVNLEIAQTQLLQLILSACPGRQEILLTGHAVAPQDTHVMLYTAIVATGTANAAL